MTVKRLIELLSAMPMNAEIITSRQEVITDSDGYSDVYFDTLEIDENDVYLNDDGVAVIGT